MGFSFFPPSFELHILRQLIATTTKETKELVRSTQQKSSSAAAVSTTTVRTILQETRIQVEVIGNLELNIVLKQQSEFFAVCIMLHFNHSVRTRYASNGFWVLTFFFFFYQSLTLISLVFGL